MARTRTGIGECGSLGSEALRKCDGLTKTPLRVAAFREHDAVAPISMRSSIVLENDHPLRLAKLYFGSAISTACSKLRLQSGAISVHSDTPSGVLVVRLNPETVNRTPHRSCGGIRVLVGG